MMMCRGSCNGETVGADNSESILVGRLSFCTALGRVKNEAVLLCTEINLGQEGAGSKRLFLESNRRLKTEFEIMKLNYVVAPQNGVKSYELGAADESKKREGKLGSGSIREGERNSAHNRSGYS